MLKRECECWVVKDCIRLHPQNPLHVLGLVRPQELVENANLVPGTLLKTKDRFLTVSSESFPSPAQGNTTLKEPMTRNRGCTVQQTDKLDSQVSYSIDSYLTFTRLQVHLRGGGGGKRSVYSSGVLGRAWRRLNHDRPNFEAFMEV